jgi:SAM-dependent methyltransferase
MPHSSQPPQLELHTITEQYRRPFNIMSAPYNTSINTYHGSGFDHSWERIYSENRHLSIWPWSDVVSFVNRYLPTGKGPQNICELGCGAGANIPFFESRGDDYYSIEGSETIVNALKGKFHNSSDKIICGDFTEAIPFEILFDAILDRGSLTHNDTKSIERCLRLCWSKLAANGIFFGFDWHSTRHSDALRGIAVDENTRTKVDSRQFQNVGNVHFSDQRHLVDIFAKAGFEIKVLVHKETEHIIGGTAELNRISAYNFVAVKVV